VSLGGWEAVILSRVGRMSMGYRNWSIK